MRILLADDESNVRFALRVLLEQKSGRQIVGEAADAKELMDEIMVACPDMVLLDWGFGGDAMTDLISTLRARCSDLALIVLSGRPEVREIALEAGAHAFINKTDPPERLLEAIGSTRRPADWR